MIMSITIAEHLANGVQNFFSDMVDRAERLEDWLRERTANYYGVKVALLSLEEQLGGLAERVESATCWVLSREPTSIARDYREHIQKYVEDKCDVVRKKIESLLDQAHGYLNCCKRSLDLQERWTKLKLPEQVLNSAPGAVEKLIEAKVAYDMAGLAFSGCKNGLEIINDTVYICVEGDRLEWKEFDQKYVWNKKWQHLVDREDENVRLTLVEGGFIKQDSYTYEKPFPIVTLSEEQFEQKKAQARLFDENRPCDSIVEVFTSPLAFRVQSHLQPVIDGLGEDAETVPSHYVVRVITSDRKVYSMGIVMDRGEDKESSPMSVAKTMRGRVKMIDPDEFWKFPYGRIITSIPCSKEQAIKVLDWVTDIQKNGGYAMNFGQMNCSTFARDVLKLVDVNVKVDVDFSEVFSIAFSALKSGCSFLGNSCFSWAETMPGVRVTSFLWQSVVEGFKVASETFSALIQTIAGIVRKVLKICYDFSPTILQKVYVCTGSIMAKPFHMISGLFKTTMIWMLGGSRMSAAANEASAHNSSFRPMLQINSFWDLFDSRTTRVDSSVRFLRWQKEQKSTKTYGYQGVPEFINLC